MIKIDEFLNNDLCDYASYDNLRKIASCIDGLKNASRKVIFTVLEKNIKEKTKVLQLANKAAEYSEYLHGDLSGVVTGLGANYTGSNNLPLMTANGNFGSRLLPAASAPRYIFTYGTDVLFKMFKKDDLKIIKNQEFEGQRIEPVFYLPTLPLLLINGSLGVSSGFKQTILQRNPVNIIEYIKSVLNGKSLQAKTISKLFLPYYKGFTGTFEEYVENDKVIPNKFLCKGKISRIANNKVMILDVPIGYDYKSYIKVLDKLSDDKKILGYRDLCDTKKDIFKFEIKMTIADLKKMSDESLLELFKLVTVTTEILTCIDENNKIRVFKTPKEIVDHFIEVKKKYLQVRKEYLINELTSDIELNASKYLFIKAIIDGDLVVNNRKKDLIIQDLSKMPKIKKKNDSYDYLLNMQMYYLTKEKLDALKNDIKEMKSKLDVVSSMSLENMYLNDIDELKILE